MSAKKASMQLAGGHLSRASFNNIFTLSFIDWFSKWLIRGQHHSLFKRKIEAWSQCGALSFSPPVGLIAPSRSTKVLHKAAGSQTNFSKYLCNTIHKSVWNHIIDVNCSPFVCLLLLYYKSFGVKPHCILFIEVINIMTSVYYWHLDFALKDTLRAKFHFIYINLLKMSRCRSLFCGTSSQFGVRRQMPRLLLRSDTRLCVTQRTRHVYAVAELAMFYYSALSFQTALCSFAAVLFPSQLSPLFPAASLGRVWLLEQP